MSEPSPTDLMRAILELGQRMDSAVSGLRADVSDLKAGQAKLEAGQAKLEAGQAELRADVAVLQSGQDDLRHTIALNHHKMLGRIEELREQLRIHIGGHQHKPAA
ncbi:MAG: hypothetical protein H7840_11140 [Alphaproteobacteria bacterium]